MNHSCFEVAAMCEQLTEGSRPVDCKIAVAIGAFARRENKTYGRVDYVDLREPGVEGWPGGGGDQFVPDYTSSVDDALELVADSHYVIAIHEEPIAGALLRRWEVRLGSRSDAQARVIVAEAGTLPAALCAAWLLVPREPPQ